MSEQKEKNETIDKKSSTKPTTKKTTTRKTTTKKTITKTITQKPTTRGKIKKIEEVEEIKETKVEKAAPRKSSRGTKSSKSTKEDKIVDKTTKPRTIKKKAKKDDQKIKQIISEQMANIEIMEKNNKISTRKRKPKKSENKEETSEESKDIKINKTSNSRHNINKENEEIKQEPIEQIKQETTRHKKFNPEEIEQKIENKKKLPKEEKKKIYKQICINICVGCIILIYFIFMMLGFKNISKEKYIIDLKAFSVFAILTTVVVFEKAYKKDSGSIAIYGIESLIISILTLILSYIYIINAGVFLNIIGIAICSIVAYYLMKSLIIFIIEKKRYRNSLSDVKEIIDDEK